MESPINTQQGQTMRWIKRFFSWIRSEYRYRKKLKETKGRDPFIYK